MRKLTALLLFLLSTPAWAAWNCQSFNSQVYCTGTAAQFSTNTPGGIATRATGNSSDTQHAYTWSGTAWIDLGAAAGGTVSIDQTGPANDVNLVTPAGDSAMDDVNDAVKVNVVTGGAGASPASPAYVTLGGGIGVTDTYIARFDATGDMPASITSSANVSASRIKFTGFAGADRRVQVAWHCATTAGPDTQATQAFFGPVAQGAMVTINAADDSTANTRLTYVDITGGGTPSTPVSDVFMVSNTSPFIEVVLNTAITRVDVIGVPNTLSTTNLDTIIPCFVELKGLAP